MDAIHGHTEIRAITGPPASFAPLCFSTDALPPGDRMDCWREAFGRSVVKVEIEPLGTHPYRCEATFRRLPDLVLTEIATTPVRLTRTAALAADGCDDVVLFLQTNGRSHLSQLGHEETVAPGDAGVMLNAEPGRTILARHNRTLSLSVPCKVLEPMVADRAALTRVIPGAADGMRLLRRYLDLIRREEAPTTLELRHAIASHIHDLVALALGATRDAREVASGRGVRVARLRAIKHDIARHLGCRELTIGWLAARHGVTPRYVGMLFESEGTSFSAFVLDRRLARARRALTEPRHRDLKISTVAFDLGFGDLSYFNRSFRRRFGATPSEVREAALLEEKAVEFGEHDMNGRRGRRRDEP